MQTKVQKWGNSLALRIPKAFAEELQLAPNSLVELRFEDGKLVLAPVVPQRYELDHLLAAITDANKHEEVEVEGVVGQETW